MTVPVNSKEYSGFSIEKGKHEEEVLVKTRELSVIFPPTYRRLRGVGVDGRMPPYLPFLL